MDIGICTPTFSVYELDARLVLIVQHVFVAIEVTTTLVVIGRAGVPLPHTEGRTNASGIAPPRASTSR
jgi:hypothetical protein